MTFAEKTMSIFKRDIFLFFSGTITSILIARKLGPEMMGIWMILNLIPIYAETFGRLKYDIASIYFLGKGIFEEKDVVRTLNSLAILVSAIICIPCFFYSEELCRILFNNSVENNSLLRICLVQIPFTFLYMNYSYLLIYREDISTYNRMVLIRALFGTVGAIFALYFLNLGLIGVITFSISGIIIAFVYSFFRFSPNGSGNYPLINFKMIKAFSAYSIKFYISGAISNLNTYLVRTLLSVLLLPTQLAFFGIAQDRANIITKIPEALNGLLFSRLSKNMNNHDKYYLTIKSLRIIAILMLLASILSVTLIYPLILLLYGKTYLSVVYPFIIFVPGILASGCMSVLLQYFNGTGRSDIQILLYSLIFIIQLFLLYFFQKTITIVIASLIFSSSSILTFIISLFIFLRHSNLKLNDIIPNRSDLEIIIDLLTSKFKKYNFINGLTDDNDDK